MKIDYLNKSRDEQEKDFLEYFKPYADPNCKLCLGTGKRHWIVALKQFQICECVLINVEATKQMQEKEIVN